MVKCPQCGHENLEGAAFCDECGASLINLSPRPAGDGGNAVPANPAPAPNTASVNVPIDNVPAGGAVMGNVPATDASAPVGKTCPQCGTVNGPNDRFCFNCGAPLTAPAQPVEPVAGDASQVVLAGTPMPQPVPATPDPVVSPPPPVPTPAPAPAPARSGQARLIAADGTEIMLPNKPEILIGREDPVSGIFPEVDMTPHGGEEGGVSRRHVRLLFQNGQYSIEDLNSTNYSFVNKQKLAPKTPHPLQDGDEVRLGRIAMTFRNS